VKRILGLDVGDKTIGVAVSDPLGYTAQGLMVIRRSNPVADMKKIEEIICQYEIGLIVLGLPRNMNGTLGEQAERVLGFGSELKARFGIKIVPWDERLSTVASEKALLEADLSRRRRKEIIDQTAAALILQNYLDSRAAGKDSGR